MDKPVRVVLVGIGGYGQSLLSALLDRKDVPAYSIVGAADPEPQRCSRLEDLKRLGVPLFGSLEEFYAGNHEADLALMAPPIHLHCAQTCLALRHCTHVMCEKPLGATIQEAARMIEARNHAQRFVDIGYQWSHSPAVQSLKRAIREGVFGAPVRLKCLVLWPRTKSYYARNYWAGALRGPHGEWVLDSPVNNAVAHYLHNMFYCLGEKWNSSAMPVEVTGELYRANPIQNYDTAALRARTASGVEVLFYATHAVKDLVGPVHDWEFKHAHVIYAGDRQEFTARFADGTTRSYGDPNADSMKKVVDVVDAVRSGAEVACPLEAASAHTLCMNGLQESAEIAEFEPSLIKVEDPTGDPIRWVPGLGSVLTQCYEKAVLPAEVHIPWARPGRTIDLRNFKSFPITLPGDEIISDARYTKGNKKGGR